MQEMRKLSDEKIALGKELIRKIVVLSMDKNDKNDAQDAVVQKVKEVKDAKDIAVEVLVESANIFLGTRFDTEKVAKGVNFLLNKVKANRDGTKKETKKETETKTDLKKIEEDVKLFWKEKNKSLEKIYGKGNVWTNGGNNYD